MQLMRLAEVPSDRCDRVFYYSRFRAITGAAALIALAGGALLWGWLNEVWLAHYAGAVLLILLLIHQKLITARFRLSNWLLRMTDHGLFIKFRSYLNHHFDDQDLTVVFILYSEIRSARLVKERQELLDRNAGNLPETSTRTRRRVELELAENTTPLAKALSSERERLFSKSVVGAGRISTRYQHLPVRLASGNFLCVEWGVVPSAQALLDALTRHTLVRNPAAVSRSVVNLDKLSREEQEARLLELIESGDSIGAVALVRQLYSYDLTAARQFVEELVTRQSNPQRLTDQ